MRDGSDDQVRQSGWKAQARIRPSRRAIPTAPHAVEVEIDPETGEVVVDRYFMVDDLGQVLNPMIVNASSMAVWRRVSGQALYAACGV